MKQHEYIMRYDLPAEEWGDAIPLGNGRLGAMAYGQTTIERYMLNEDSLWNGGWMDRNNPKLKEVLPEIRRRIFAGEIPEAEDLIQRYMVGAPSMMRHYDTMGELDIAINELSPFNMGWVPNSRHTENYHGELDLMRGVQTVTWSRDGVNYIREAFISHPDHALCIRIRADKHGAITLNAQLERCMVYDNKVADDRRPGVFVRGGIWGGMFLDENHTRNAKTLVGRGNSGGTEFAMAVCMDSDGTVEDPYTQLYTSGASCVCLYLAASTANREKDPLDRAMKDAQAAQALGFDELLSRHIKDFEPLMRRCELYLGDDDGVPTDKHIELAKEKFLSKDNSADPYLAALYFTFGRYLMVAGGREDSTALNLQGIWNKDFVPAWDSKYTTNINVQMNYWPAEVTNLSELHNSFFDLIRRVCERGKETARVMYGMRGSVCHHNTDYYGDTAPQDTYMASTSWPTGGAWMALHLWDHYKYTLDKDFLREWRPIMREFALFFLDYLCDDGTGHLVTCPSVSPENRYILPSGYDSPICAGPTMDNQILRELFGACIASAEILGIDDPLCAEFAEASSKLYKNAVGSKGQLLEWLVEYPELTPGMSHISHLYGSYPGAEINWRDTPELIKASAKSLALRVEHGSGPNKLYGGWPLAWYICQYARYLDAEKAGNAISQMVCSSGTRNLFNGRRVFQIDGNLGATAGIAEVLLQSHTGIIHLLPALPPQWKSGSVSGMRARGNVTVDIEWNDGRLTSASIVSAFDKELELRADGDVKVYCGDKEIETRAGSCCIVFPVKAGEVYTVRG